MFFVKKKFEISASHKLKLDYPSKCSNLHGHNWLITIICKSDRLDQSGMVYDFSKLKDSISKILDHTDISDKIIIDDEILNPTAENIAFFISKIIGEKCVEVNVQESEDNEATWRLYAY